PSKREQLIVSAGSNRTIELHLSTASSSSIPEPTGAAAKRLAYSWKLSELVEGKYVLQVDVTFMTKPAQQRHNWTAAGSVDGDQKIESYHWQVCGGRSADGQDLHSVSQDQQDPPVEQTSKPASIDAKVMSDSATANITSFPSRTTKPKASAGQSIRVIYLPQIITSLLSNWPRHPRSCAERVLRDDTGVKSLALRLCLTGPQREADANAPPSQRHPSPTCRPGVYKLRAEAVDLDGGVGSAVVTVDGQAGPQIQRRGDAGRAIRRCRHLDGHRGYSWLRLTPQEAGTIRALLSNKWTRQDGLPWPSAGAERLRHASPACCCSACMPGRLQLGKVATRDTDAAILVRPWPHAASVWPALSFGADPSATAPVGPVQTFDVADAADSARRRTPAAATCACWGLRRRRSRPGIVHAPVGRLPPTGTYLPGPRLAAPPPPPPPVLKRRLRTATLLEFPVLGAAHARSCQLGMLATGAYCDNFHQTVRSCAFLSAMENPRCVFDSAMASPTCDWSVASCWVLPAAVWLLLLPCPALSVRPPALRACGCSPATGQRQPKFRRLEEKLRYEWLGGGGCKRIKVLLRRSEQWQRSGGRIAFSLSSDEEDTAVQQARRPSEPQAWAAGRGGAGDGRRPKADHNSNRIPIGVAQQRPA
uniref:PKD_channel domain-containing protein n=1 Tax=Macrostomum lignano TaxID=282301 RepID=A0A1I8FRI2_9PLAT